MLVRPPRPIAAFPEHSTTATPLTPEVARWSRVRDGVVAAAAMLAVLAGVASGQANCTEGFEGAGWPAGWSAVGSNGITASTAVSVPAQGAKQAALASGVSWPYFLSGVTGDSVDLNTAAAFLGVPATTLEEISPGVTTWGSAAKFVVTADAGDAFEFRWDFCSFEFPGETIFRDYAALTIVSATSTERFLIADTTSAGPIVLPGIGGWHTGYRTFNHVFASSGTYSIGIAVFDVDDELNDSGLLIDLMQFPGPDSDGDGYADCVDGCPNDPLKTSPGQCGCGVADVATTYYRDLDADGYGDVAATQPGYTCAVLPGYVAIAGDCDDSNPAIHPGAPEGFNGLDDDCDGFIDEGLASPARVSVSSAGQQSDGDSRAAMVSDDGRHVAFKSLGTNLVPGDTNGVGDLFIRDTQDGVTRIVSVSSSGAPGDGESYHPAPSADGRFVAFFTSATNLVAADTNGKLDVLLRDTLLGTTVLVSKSTIGGVGNNDSAYPSISLDGNQVAFQSSASNLIVGDTNSRVDIFVRNVALASTVNASVSPGGGLANGNSTECAISGNGRYVAFSSEATNLVSGDTNGARDIFVRDLQTGTTVRVSRSSAGAQGNEGSDRPAISADGRFVAYESNASNLAPGDTNGLTDVFLFDLQTGTTAMLSQGNGASIEAAISSDGDIVVFTSSASNLVANDSNLRDDIFASYHSLGQLFLVSASAAGTQGNDHSRSPTVSAAGRSVAYRSDASNLVPFDTNALGDVFANVPLQAFYLDADADTFGNPAVRVISLSPPSGYVSNALDCNDGNPAIHPGVPELCNGVDDDCNGVIDDGFLATYCTAGTTVYGCVPAISGAGGPSSSAPSGFDIVVSAVPGQRNGTIFYGFYSANAPWSQFSPSFRCVAYPVQRMGDRTSGGSIGQCNGELRVDFNAWRSAHPGALGNPFLAGQVFYAQGWFRDPGAPKQTNLSDGLMFTLCD